MALQPFTGRFGLKMYAFPEFLTNNSSSSTTLDATGESCTFIGKVFLEGGSGSKTISSGGGKILWKSTSSPVFANSGTKLRVGIQDVNASGIEDGTFDVYKELTGGTDTIANNADNLTAMATGSKTINHNDLIAVSIEMVTRAGADTLGVNQLINTAFEGQQAVALPYRTTDTGAGPTKVATNPAGFVIEFDDGTLGWFAPFYTLPSYGAPASQTYAANSTPDEYAAVFKLPFKCAINEVMLIVGNIATTDTFEVVLYSDPTGTPSVIETVVMDPNVIGSSSTGAYMAVPFSQERTLEANVWYAVALRPTSNNTITFHYHSLGSGFEKYKRINPFGENIKFSSRTNQTGAFTEVQTYYLPVFGINISKLDDGLDFGIPKQRIVEASTY